MRCLVWPWLTISLLVYAVIELGITLTMYFWNIPWIPRNTIIINQYLPLINLKILFFVLSRLYSFYKHPFNYRIIIKLFINQITNKYYSYIFQFRPSFKVFDNLPLVLAVWYNFHLLPIGWEDWTRRWLVDSWHLEGENVSGRLVHRLFHFFRC